MKPRMVALIVAAVAGAALVAAIPIALAASGGEDGTSTVRGMPLDYAHERIDSAASDNSDATAPVSYDLDITRVYGTNQEAPNEVEFRASLWGDNMTGVTLLSPTKVTILTAGLDQPPLIIHQGYQLLNSSGQSYYKIGSPSDMESRFPLGDYTLQIKYYDPATGKVKKASLVHSLVGPFPPRPVIIYPADNQTGVELQPTVEWARAPDDGRFSYYYVDIGMSVPGTPHWQGVLSTRIDNIDQTQYQVPAGALQPGTTYGVWVGIAYDGTIDSKSPHQFTTAAAP